MIFSARTGSNGADEFSHWSHLVRWDVPDATQRDHGSTSKATSWTTDTASIAMFLWQLHRLAEACRPPASAMRWRGRSELPTLVRLDRSVRSSQSRAAPPLPARRRGVGLRISLASARSADCPLNHVKPLRPVAVSGHQIHSSRRWSDPCRIISPPSLVWRVTRCQRSLFHASLRNKWMYQCAGGGYLLPASH